jgi:hypothetical protein
LCPSFKPLADRILPSRKHPPPVASPLGSGGCLLLCQIPAGRATSGGLAGLGESCPTRRATRGGSSRSPRAGPRGGLLNRLAEPLAHGSGTHGRL